MSDSAPRGLAGPLCVLLVEDDADHRMIAEHHLGKLKDSLGEVLHAESLAEARATLNTGGIDVVLLDLTLPDSTLEETLAAIGELAPHCTQVVAMSSLDVDDVSGRAVANGAASFLAKQDMNAKALQSIFAEVKTARAAGGRSEPHSRTGKAPVSQVAPASEHDPHKLASRWAHDALGWAANITFRTSVLQADPALASSPNLAGHIESLRASADALTSFIIGGRNLVVTELAAHGTAPGAEREVIDLAQCLKAASARWVKSKRSSLTVSLTTQSTVTLPKEIGPKLLGQVIAALLSNAVDHSGSAVPGQPEIHFREVPHEGPMVVIECTDDGGPWNLDGSSVPGNPMDRGHKGTPSAGLGLYTSRRAMEAMGGTLKVTPRADSPGAFAVRLTLPG